MTYADLILDLRIEVADEQKTEFTDDALMSFLRRAVKRIGEIVIRNELRFALAKELIPAVDGQLIYSLPTNFGAQKELYIPDSPIPVELVKQEDMAAHTGLVWAVISDSEFILSEPVTDHLTLFFFPCEEFISDVNTPVRDGKYLWDALLGYAAFLAKNREEMDTNIDIQTLGDIEQQLVLTHLRNLPQVQHLQPGTW